MKKTQLVGGSNFNPFEQQWKTYARQIGIISASNWGWTWKIFELPPPPINNNDFCDEKLLVCDLLLAKNVRQDRRGQAPITQSLQADPVISSHEPNGLEVSLEGILRFFVFCNIFLHHRMYS